MEMSIKLVRCAALMMFVFLAGCAESKFETYTGPEVTKLEVHKGDRIIKVFHGNRLLKKYAMELGFGAEGHKQFEGDGRTPEGRYTIDRRNPNSSFYLSLGISYPNARDIAHARSQGKDPGGEIFIHGQPNLLGPRGPDWTAGCIAVTNKEMRTLYAMVKNGTTIDIFP
jgi:murein L,D-transpeptidase YafK